jgi:hypothetical protein
MRAVVFASSSGPASERNISTAGDQLHQPRNHVRVEQPCRHRDVARPQRLQVHRDRVAVRTDVRHASAGPHQLSRQLERLGYTHRFEGDVRAEPSGSSVARASSETLKSEPKLRRALEAAVSQFDRDDPPRRVECRSEKSPREDRPGADNCQDTARRDHAVAHRPHTRSEGRRPGTGPAHR